MKKMKKRYHAKQAEKEPRMTRTNTAAADVQKSIDEQTAKDAQIKKRAAQ